MLSAPPLVNNFMSSLAQRSRDFAVPELFSGRPTEASHRLVLDHDIPLRLTDNKQYGLKLQAYLRFVENDAYHTSFFAARLTYRADYIVCGPVNWQGFIDSLAYQLIASLRITVGKLNSPTYLIVKPGDITDLEPQMRRIWIA